MMNWIISSTVLILVVIALRFLLKGKISLRLQYALWALVMIRLLIPFSIGETMISIGNGLDYLSQTKEVSKVYEFTRAELPSMSYQQAYEEVADKYQNQGIDISTIPEEEFAETVDYEIKETMTGEWSLAEIAKGVWIVGSIVVGVWFVVANFKLQRKLVSNRKLLQLDKTSIATETNAMIEACKDKLSIYVCDEIDTPCLFGLLHPSIYVTSEVLKDEAALRHVIAHEKTHYLHGDHIWGYCRALCLAIHWYNPFVWSAAFLSRNDAELACDEATISYLGEQERACYGRTLIDLTCEKRPAVLATATTMTGSGKAIKERITMIAKKPKMALITLIVVVVVAIIAVLYTFTGGKQYASFEEWTSTLEAEDIQYAMVTRGYGIEESAYVVPEEEYEELCNLLKTITDEKCFRRKQEGSRTGDSLYIKRADRDWVFQCLDDGTIGLLFDTESGAYFGSEGKRLIIESPELWDYIMKILEEKATSREELSEEEQEQLRIEMELSQEEVERQREEAEKMVEFYQNIEDGVLVTDEDVTNRITNLLQDENEFDRMLNCEYGYDGTQDEYQINGYTVFLVQDASDWGYYEELARKYYAESYIENKFTPFFLGNVYIEEGGKLYRTIADGIVNPIIGSTIKVWQSDNGKYYVSITADSVGYGYYTQAYILDLSEDSIYGFEILEKISILDYTTYVIEDESEDTTYIIE